MPNRTTERQVRVIRTGHTNYGKQRGTDGNTGLAKVAVQCSAATFVVKTATFAKPETVSSNAKRQNTL